MRGSRIARIVGMVFMFLWGALATLFVVGEAFMDPGGTTAWVMSAAWIVPMVVLIGIGWFAPADLATRILAGAVGLVGAAWVTNLFFADAWQAFFDRNGPVLAVAGIAVTVPLAALARRRPTAAGLLLLVAAVVPMLFSGTLGNGGFGRSATVASIPNLVIGALFLGAGQMERDAGRAT